MKILSNCQENILLKLIKYNKVILKRLNISIIESIIRYNTIKIEIIPAAIPEDKKSNEHFQFININKDRLYYHIFFNENNEEIYRNYFTR